MAAKSQGQVLERVWKSGRGYALRFRAYGERQYVTLGLERDGWTRKRAEDELQNIVADVRRGLWIPPDRRRRNTASDGGPDPAPRFGPFAREYVAARKAEVQPRTYQYLEWALDHLLPYFADWPLSDIDVEAVDGYRRHKTEQAELRRRAIERRKAATDDAGRVVRPLSPGSINKTIEVLQSILAIAVEYGHLDANPAAGRRRRIKLPPRRPVHLDSADQIQALLDVAAEMDRKPYWRTSDRSAIIATLVFAGPRAHELCRLLWRDVDLANGRIYIGRSKTQAGLREIPLLPILRDDLAAHKARSYRAGPDDRVFPTGTGGIRDKDNLRNRILAAVLEPADQLLQKRGQSPLPRGLTPHKLRHTFASILVACGEDPASVMAQLGHTDPKFTLRVYTHMMRRDRAERERLKALVGINDTREAPVPALAG
ncbi:MAG: integrase [Thermoleophilaceae bacterium]|jgi:integrase|nr:integrase [Thermoleophilaceae bacterium]